MDSVLSAYYNDKEKGKKKKKDKGEGEDDEKPIRKGSGVSLIVTDCEGGESGDKDERESPSQRKKKKHTGESATENGETGEKRKSLKKKKDRDENGDLTEEKDIEKDPRTPKKEGLLEKVEKRRKDRERKSSSMRFKKAQKGSTIIIPKNKSNTLQGGLPKGYSADDMDASPRKKRVSLETPSYSNEARPSISEATGLRMMEENKPDKLSRWASLKGIRGTIESKNFLRSPQPDDQRRMRSFSGSLLESDIESTTNPLVALAQKQQALELKKEREILSEDPSLDERTLKRHKVINEIINTERDYINDLNKVIKIFLEPLGKEGILTPEEVKDIFSNVKLLVNVNQALLEDLSKQAKQTNGEELGQSFVLLSHYLKMYSQYCGNQKVSREAFANALKNNSRFKAFLEKQATLPELNNLSLKDYLIKPVQRLCKYPLLLRELIKYTDESHPDYQKLEAAFENIQEAVESVNSQKQTEEEMEEVAEMLNTLTGAEKFGVQLMVPGRRFVKEGIVKTTTKDHTTSGTSHYYIFSDLLILAEDGSNLGDAKKKPKKGPVKKEVTGMLPFGMCLLTSAPDDEANGVKNIAEIIQSTKIFIFHFDSPEEKEEWTKLLRIEHLAEENKKEAKKKLKKATAT